MNAVDIAIIGAIGLVALIGLKSGVIKPVSGMGGFILGVFLAIQNYGLVVPYVAQYIEGPMIQKIAAFIAVVLIVAIAARVVGFIIKKLMSLLVLGWLDNVAGMVGGAAVATAIVGTVFYVASGLSFASNNPAFATSRLAPEVSRVTLISSQTPWCTTLSADAIASGTPCASILGMAGDLVGMDFGSKTEELTGGQDVGSIVDVVKSSLSGGSAADFASIAQQQLEANNISVDTAGIEKMNLENLDLDKLDLQNLDIDQSKIDALTATQP